MVTGPFLLRYTLGMKVLHISDLHTDVFGAERWLQNEGLFEDDDVELVCFTGDMVRNNGFMWENPGYEGRLQRKEWKRMVELFEATWPHANFVALRGNHDYFNYYIPKRVRSFDEVRPKTIKLRGLKITGFAGVPHFGGHWWGEASDRLIEHMIDGLDFSAHIVLTHTPPYGILDSVTEYRQVGAFGFEEWFTNHPWCKRRVHMFGHIHECGGETVYKNGVTYSNASGTCNKMEIDL